MTIGEFASCDQAEFETAVTGEWKYSEQLDDDGNGNTDVEADQKPPPAMKARARAAHNAARIRAGSTWSRNRRREHERTNENEERGYKEAKIEALGKPTALATLGGASASTCDTAAMNEIVEATKRRGSQ